MKGKTKVAIILSCIGLWLTYKFTRYLYIESIKDSCDHCWQANVLFGTGIIIFSTWITIIIMSTIYYVSIDKFDTDEIIWYYWLSPIFWIIRLIQWLLHLGDKYLSD